MDKNINNLYDRHANIILQQRQQSKENLNSTIKVDSLFQLCKKNNEEVEHERWSLFKIVDLRLCTVCLFLIKQVKRTLWVMPFWKFIVFIEITGRLLWKLALFRMKKGREKPRISHCIFGMSEDMEYYGRELDISGKLVIWFYIIKIYNLASRHLSIKYYPSICLKKLILF